MNILALNSKEEDKKIITFTINKEIKQKLRQVLIESTNYNLKKKSDWVNEAIILLKNNPDYKEMVGNAEVSEHSDFVHDKIYMTFEQRCFFAEIKKEVVKEYPEITGPQAAIIRAAVLSRLTRKS